MQEFRSQLTAEDTTTMLQLCDNAMKELKARNIDKVLASLYEYTDSTQEVKPLSDKLKKNTPLSSSYSQCWTTREFTILFSWKDVMT